MRCDCLLKALCYFHPSSLILANDLFSQSTSANLADEVKFKTIIPASSLVVRDHCWLTDGKWLLPVSPKWCVGPSSIPCILDSCFTRNYICWIFGISWLKSSQFWARWWEHVLSTNVAWVRFTDSAHVYFVFVGFLLCSVSKSLKRRPRLGIKLSRGYRKAIFIRQFLVVSHNQSRS